MTHIFLLLSGNTIKALKPLVTQRIGAVLISIGITFMLNTAALAEFKQVKTLSRPTIDGTWRVVSVDQRNLKHPIKSFRAEFFSSRAYFPIGTTFFLENRGGPVNQENPTYVELYIEAYAPFPKEVCPEVPFLDEEKNRQYHPLCGRNGLPKDKAGWAKGEIGVTQWEFNDGAMELQRLRLEKKRYDGGRTRRDVDELAKVGIPLGSTYYQMTAGTLSFIFYPRGRDTLLMETFYSDDRKRPYDPELNNSGIVFFIAERVTK
jgi:hypothetical protein